MKYKKLTQEQLLISLDRLTRFKKTKNKYLRVFSEIIISNLLEPKFNKKQLENMDFAEVTDYATKIINYSLGVSEGNCIINKKIKEYENKIFYNDDETQKFLDNAINYEEAIKYIPDECVINLKWLKSLLNETKSKNYKYPLTKIIIAEGITEEILLPKFSQVLNYDFDLNGVHIIAAGGKNQVVKLYYELSQEVKIPIFVLLDKDAEENIAQIRPKLRQTDKIHLVSCGEFEDILPLNLIKKTINSHFKNFLSVNIEDLTSENSMVYVLEELFKTKGLHEFKKAEFAKLVCENITSVSDISSEIQTIIEEIINTNKSLDSEICS